MKDRFEHRTPETTISYGTRIYYSCSGYQNTATLPPVVLHINLFRIEIMRIYAGSLNKRTERSLQRGDLLRSTMKEPLDTTLHFDKEGLNLAFQYFVSPTL